MIHQQFLNLYSNNIAKYVFKHYTAMIKAHYLAKGKPEVIQAK